MNGMSQTNAAADAAWMPISPVAHAGRRNDGLDVARALAILLVLFAHFGTPLFELNIQYTYAFTWLGAAGVNIFFSLSGFLIGRLLLSLAGRGVDGPGILTFWARRWLRTLPLYYIVLTFMALYSGMHDIRSYLFLQNFTFGRPQPLVVSWSLVLEEFFYLFYPLLMLLATMVAPRRLAGRRSVVGVSVGLIILCNAARWAVSHWQLPIEWPSMNPFLRLDCCAYGVLAACAVAAGGERLRVQLRRFAPVILPLAALLIVLEIGVVVGLSVPSLVAAMRFDIWHEFWFTIDSMFVPAVAAFAVPTLAAAAPVLARPFGAVVRRLSLLSYALYLVHTVVMFGLGPVLALRMDKLSATAVMLGASVLIAWGLNHAVERPFLRLRDRFVPDRRRVA